MNKLLDRNSGGTKVSFSAHKLAEFITTNEVAWQMYGTNIGFSWNSYHEYIDENDRLIEEDLNKRMLRFLSHSKECAVFNPDTDDGTCFKDLIEWSKGQDLLILADNELLLCIAPYDKEQVLAMAV